MTLSGGLCSICKAVLCPELGELSLDDRGRISIPKQTIDIFQDAALESCAICSAIMSRTKKDQRSWLASESAEVWRPLIYEVQSPRGGWTVTRVTVISRDPISRWEVYSQFRLVAADDTKYSSWFDSPDVEARTSSEATLNMAYKWFQSCHATHRSCRQLTSLFPQKLPTRLIDIGTNGNALWYLRIDAITVTRLLGVQYMWIDALCIIQDSRSDWEAEAPTMRYVYSNSTCNIAATTSNDPEDGIFRVRDPKSIRPRLIKSSLHREEPSPHYIYEEDYWDKEIFDGPLHNRGWVFQERFLSPRVIYFGKHQVLWECLTEHKCEGFPRGIPDHLSDKSVGLLLQTLAKRNSGMEAKESFDIHHKWNSLVQQYSRCELTNPSDKLVAMAGIAKLFKDVTGDEYVAGWWKSGLLPALDWHAIDPKPRLGVGYRAPSWSWASIDSPIHINSWDWEFLVKLVDVNVVSRDPDSMANILEAVLKIRGNLITALCHPYNDVVWHLRNERGDGKAYLQRDSLNMDEVSEGKKVYIIPYRKYEATYYPVKRQSTNIRCLVVETAGTHGDTLQYRRIGQTVFHSEELFNEFEIRREESLIELV